MTAMTTGQKIAFARRMRGITQEELAGRVGVSRQSVSKWESDLALPETDKLVRLCDELGVSCDELLRPGELTGAPASGNAPAAGERSAPAGKKGDEFPAARSHGRAPLSPGAVAFLAILFVVGGLLLVAAAAMFFALSGGGIGDYIGSVAVLFFLGIGLIVLAVLVKLFLQKK